MNRTKHDAQSLEFEGPLHSATASAATLTATAHVETVDDLDGLFKEDTDFDVEEDIAFLGEEYDVMELDDVLELCNVGREDTFDA